MPCLNAIHKYGFSFIPPRKENWGIYWQFWAELREIPSFMAESGIWVPRFMCGAVSTHICVFFFSKTERYNRRLHTHPLQSYCHLISLMDSCILYLYYSSGTRIAEDSRIIGNRLSELQIWLGQPSNGRLNGEITGLLWKSLRHEALTLYCKLWIEQSLSSNRRRLSCGDIITFLKWCSLLMFQLILRLLSRSLFYFHLVVCFI